MRSQHRRFRFWTLFLILAVLLAYCLHAGVLKKLSAWIPDASRIPATLLVEVQPTEPADEPLVARETLHFPDKKALEDWEQKVFKGKTLFEVRNEDGRSYLSSESIDACSGLFMKTKHVATPELFLSWKWRVRHFPEKKDPEKLSSRREDDFGARLYVIFEASNLFRSDVIEYIWDESIPAGTVAESPYSDRIKLFVIRSGPPDEARNGWRNELRNPLEDYVKLFGKTPKNPIGILALMSDSDNTGSRAAADFEEIIIGSKKSS